MNERDIRLLFDAGHWSDASVTFVAEENAWQVYLNVTDKQEQEVLTLKSGSPRHFKTSDTAINWCHEIGFKKISVHLSPSLTSVNLNKSLRVVLVEDNSADIELIVRAFQNLDTTINVLVFQNGVEALNFLHAKGEYKYRDANELPSIILLDLKLPMLNGHEVLKAIRSNKITTKIPVIVLSTSTEESDVSLSYDLGSNSYINKPIAYEEFSNTIQEIATYWLDYNTNY